MSFIRDFCTVYTCAFLFLSSFINEQNNSFLNKKLNEIDNKLNRICIHNNIKFEEHPNIEEHLSQLAHITNQPFETVNNK
jgi:hypothetical protein